MTDNAAKEAAWEAFMRVWPECGRSVTFAVRDAALEAAIAAYNKALRAAGYEVVPVEPTEAMMEACVTAPCPKDTRGQIRAEWQAMIKACREEQAGRVDPTHWMPYEEPEETANPLAEVPTTSPPEPSEEGESK